MKTTVITPTIETNKTTMKRYYEFDEGFLFKAYYWDEDKPYEKAAHIRTILANNFHEAYEIANDKLIKSHDLFKLEEIRGSDLCISEQAFNTHYKNDEFVSKNELEQAGHETNSNLEQS